MPFRAILGGCLGYLITGTDWTESFLVRYMQGQEKLTFVVILFFFCITLCLTLISANEKGSSSLEIPEEDSLLSDVRAIDSFLPIRFTKFVISSIVHSVKTIVTMPFVLRRLTLAECCSWYERRTHMFHVMISLF